MNNSRLSLPNVIDGVTGSNNSVNMCKSHYDDLFNEGSLITIRLVALPP